MCTETNHGNQTIFHSCWMWQNMDSYCKTIDLEGCVCKRKTYQHIIQNNIKIHQQMYQQLMKTPSIVSVKKSSQIGPRSAQWSKRCSGLVGGGCDLPPESPTMKQRTNLGRQAITHASRPKGAAQLSMNRKLKNIRSIS